MKKCSEEGFCESLDYVLEDSENAKKGITIMTMMRFKGVAIRTGKKNSGAWVNYCPFCGADLTIEDYQDERLRARGYNTQDVLILGFR